ncbi:hypothetical protein GCM10027347_58820 [Larkinella harenae]
MKTLSISLALLALFALGCKKNNKVNPKVDISSLAGVYDCQTTLTYGRNGELTTTRPTSSTLTVSIASNNDPKLLMFHEQYYGNGRDYTVYFDNENGEFVVNKFEEKVSVDGVLFSGVANGSGKFTSDGKKVSLSTSTDVIAVGPFNRSIKIEGTKR